MMRVWGAALMLMLMVLPVFGAKGAGFVMPQYSQRMSLDFKGADLKDVLKAFSVQIGANFIVRPDVSAKSVTVYLDNVPVEEAFAKVLSVNGLAYDYDESLNLFVIRPEVADLGEVPAVRVFSLKYASVDSSRIRSAAGSSSGAISPIVLSVLTAKGKVVDDARTNSLVITDVPSNFPNIERMIARIDVPVKQIIIEVEMLDVSKTTADTVGAKYNLSASFSGTSKPSFFPFKKVAPMAATSNATGVDFAATTLALDFIKSQSDTKSLARPRIMTMDNDTATIQISTDEAIGIVQQTSTAGTSNTQQAERAKTGVFLTVTPQVNPLTDEITMIVEPKVVDASSISTFTSSQGKATFNNPEERGIKVSLRVPNGKTIVIGGLLRRTRSDTETAVPFLGDIPFFGAPFRHHDKSNRERELMIFLTPHVIDQDARAPDAGDYASRALDVREQSFPDSRQGLIDRELDSVTVFRQQ